MKKLLLFFALAVSAMANSNPYVLTTMTNVNTLRFMGVPIPPSVSSRVDVYVYDYTIEADYYLVTVSYNNCGVLTKEERLVSSEKENSGFYSVGRLVNMYQIQVSNPSCVQVISTSVKALKAVN